MRTGERLKHQRHQERRQPQAPVFGKCGRCGHSRGDCRQFENVLACDGCVNLIIQEWAIKQADFAELSA
jgi:hypothetical protein